MVSLLKELIWVGSSRHDLKSFPAEVKDEVGFSLHQIQEGKVPFNVKPLKGFKPSVMEIVTDFDGNAYRTVYTVKIGSVVYVLHAFQKKSKTGIKTPQKEIDLVKQRLRVAQMLAEQSGGA